MLDDVERAVDDGVNSYKLLGKDARAVPAGGASEIEIARQLQQFGRKVGGGEGQVRTGWVQGKGIRSAKKRSTSSAWPIPQPATVRPPHFTSSPAAGDWP